MPKDTQTDIEKLSPDKLLWRFSKSGIVLCIILAFALHVIVLGGASVDYIHGIIDPAWKQQQDRLEEAAREKADAQRRKSLIPRAAARSSTRPATSPTSAPADANRRLPKNITTMPKKGETPKLPGSGIGLDETEGR